MSLLPSPHIIYTTYMVAGIFLTQTQTMHLRGRECASGHMRDMGVPDKRCSLTLRISNNDAAAAANCRNRVGRRKGQIRVDRTPSGCRASLRFGPRSARQRTLARKVFIETTDRCIGEMDAELQQ